MTYAVFLICFDLFSSDIIKSKPQRKLLYILLDYINISESISLIMAQVISDI